MQSKLHYFHTQHINRVCKIKKLQFVSKSDDLFDMVNVDALDLITIEENRAFS